jgi:hypothetical protein
MHGKRIATRIALTSQRSPSTNRLSRCADHKYAGRRTAAPRELVDEKPNNRQRAAAFH